MLSNISVISFLSIMANGTLSIKRVFLWSLILSVVFLEFSSVRNWFLMRIYSLNSLMTKVWNQITEIINMVRWTLNLLENFGAMLDIEMESKPETIGNVPLV
ncbi:hypothetical protein WICPIJ_009859 [Wickerhamomyces pijperi]|uniref:Uncharacterized protein n=1 Tax=Wickerhamomyces pijperi TaxID=599730 RepID=A0A9P8PKJ9_WICPI|nr:hypothetical protein WICPIJ_009859 [Wickerhamomyces pijperi]